LERFLERTFCEGVHFSYRIFLNLLFGLETTSFQSVFKVWKAGKSMLGLRTDNRVDGAQRMSDVLPDNSG
jgi:hypothetical protein